MIVRSYPHAECGNTRKTRYVVETLRACVKAVRVLHAYNLRCLYQQNRVKASWLVKEQTLQAFPAGTVLSQRYVKELSNQANAVFNSFVANTLTVRFRSTVTHSSLPEDTKRLLYRINRNKLWFAVTRVIPASKTQPEEAYSDEVARLARHISKHVIAESYPNLQHLRTLTLGGTVAQVERAKSSVRFPYWLKLSVLNHVPVRIPLKRNPYAEKQGGQWRNFIQARLDGNSYTVRLAKNIEPATATPHNNVTLGLDWGMVSLFTDSNENHYGRALHEWLKTIDEELLTLQKTLQTNRIKYCDSKRYLNLQHRIREYVKNEVNRTLNNIIRKQQPTTLAVEQLDFRKTGLSKTMNRILTRAGRGAVKQKLADLQQRNIVTVTEVNPAYTSQECSKCHTINKRNRTTQKHFHCVNCDHRINADVNAARNIHGRSVNGLTLLGMQPEKVKRAVQTFWTNPLRQARSPQLS